MIRRKKTDILKIVVLGNAGVGKTSIIYRFAKNHYSEFYKQTLGIDCLSKTINVEGHAVTLQVSNSK